MGSRMRCIALRCREAKTELRKVNYGTVRTNLDRCRPTCRSLVTTLCRFLCAWRDVGMRSTDWLQIHSSYAKL